MATGSRTEDASSPILSVQMRNTIQSIKEVVKDHSDAEIYIALKETNMDPNETAQKLLLQDPFHEVKSKRDKRKESMGYKGSSDPRKHDETSDRGMKYNKFPDRSSENADRGLSHNRFPDRNSQNSGQGMKNNKFPDRNADQGMRCTKFPDRNADQGMRYTKFPDRNADAGQGTKYNELSDRNSENSGQGMKYNKFLGRNADGTGQVMKYSKFSDRTGESSGLGTKYNAFPDRNVRRGGYARNALPGVTREFRVVRDNRANKNSDREVKLSSSQTSTDGEVVLNPSEKGLASSSDYQKPLDEIKGFQPSNGPNESQPRYARKDVLEGKQATVASSVSQIQAVKPSNSQPTPAALTSSNSVVGLYSSSTDPVHVPSPDSRSSAGVVGVRRQPSENSMKNSPSPTNLSNSASARNKSTESSQHFSSVSKTDQNAEVESIIPGISSRLPSNNNQYNSRQHQVSGHQKALQPNKEWKPKSSQKTSAINPGPGVIGTPTKSASPPVDNSKDLESVAADLQNKNTLANIHENQNVIIAQHIRVPETDRYRLTFGSFGVEFDNSRNFVSGEATDESVGESAASSSVSVPESSTDDATGSKQADLLDDQVQNSGSDSSPSDRHSVDKNESSSPQDIESYADIGLVQDSSPSYAPSVSQQRQDLPELPSFSTYAPQTGYEMPYFRSTMDESLRVQGLPSPQESLNSIPASTIAMAQQQHHPQQVPQMYPQQVHVSHFTNLMPYRQLLSPVYVPPVAMPGYSSNPAYPHPPNASNYLLMPGGGAQYNGGLKYGVQPFKPVPGGSPTGYGNFPNPAGYAINASGVVGNAGGLEDSSRIKYKDTNLYIPNPQAETSEMWIQNPRDVPLMQSARYYVSGQTPHAAAYMPSHTGHIPFNPTAAQPSHVQFQGMYHHHHPQQAAAMGGPHHLGPAIGGNVGLGVVPQAGHGGQVGAYQQQGHHLNWATNF